jgi:NAD(P)-dependent dehydrogenase (short-subunit alcohol dehydrogenase family)
MATVLITGGNRGIGLELARQLSQRGDHVIATARRPFDPGTLPQGATQIAMDVASAASVATAASELSGRPIDVIINNAGQLNGYGGLGDPAHTQEAWQALLMANVAGPYFVADAFLPHLKAGHAKKLIIITSAMGSSEQAKGGAYPYRASKAAATNLARNLAVDLKPLGIAVAAYHPGWVRTDMGGPSATLSVAESAQGLIAQCDALTLATTGLVADYQGKRVPY